MARLYHGRRVKGRAGDVLAMPRYCLFPLAVWFALTFGGCGGIRYAQVAPESRDFHPQAIALLSLDVVGQEEARTVLDRLIVDALTKKGTFKKILSAETIQGLCQKDETLRQTTAAYLGKLEAVSFSDRDLSRKIAENIGADAFLLVDVDYWYYTKEANRNVAKVGLSMRLISADNGLLIWKAGHDLAPDYVFRQPELKGIAKDVVKRMIGAMPH